MLAGALLRLMDIAPSRDGVASGAGLARVGVAALSPPAACRKLRFAWLLHFVPALRVQPASIGGDCRSAPAAHPAIPAPGAVL